MFIEDFLQSRNFQVRARSCLAQLGDQEMGVPQGSIRFVNLFGLKIKKTLSLRPSLLVSYALYTCMTY